MLKAFLALNRGLCARIKAKLPQCRTTGFDEYGRMAQTLLNTPRTVLDVGGGGESHIGQFCPKGSAVIALDISAEELARNREVTQKVVADACQGIPLRTESVDIVTSYSVLEHLSDVAGFSRHAFRVLRPGGVMLHVFPCRNAIFAVMNRLLPFKVSRWLIAVLHDLPKTRGFPAHYDRCSPARIERALTEAGFQVETMALDYHQSFWFTFFAPLYAMGVLYELVLVALRLRALCGHVVVLARKPSGVAPVTGASARNRLSSSTCNSEMELV